MIQNFTERNNRQATLLIFKALLNIIILVIEMSCKINRRFAEFQDFIRPVITRQRSFSLILSP